MKIKIKRALISLSDKDNLKAILKHLKKYKIKIISTGGTYKEITRLGFKCTEISDYTGEKEILSGRVKTLHPKIHSGILNIRENQTHQKQIKDRNYDNIDLVIVNFYPFEKVLLKNLKHSKIIENIDIGGPTMVRASAKNYRNVVTLCNPCQYEDFLDEININKGSTSLKFKRMSKSVLWKLLFIVKNF